MSQFSSLTEQETVQRLGEKKKRFFAGLVKCFKKPELYFIVLFL